jgi:hypothetical protein
MTPAHKQTDPAKAPGQIVKPVGLTVRTLGDYLKLKETLSCIPSATTKEFDFGWNSALAEIAKFVEGLYHTDYFDEFDNGFGGALDAVEEKIGGLKK